MDILVNLLILFTAGSGALAGHDSLDVRQLAQRMKSLDPGKKESVVLVHKGVQLPIVIERDKGGGGVTLESARGANPDEVSEADACFVLNTDLSHPSGPTYLHVTNVFQRRHTVSGLPCKVHYQKLDGALTGTKLLEISHDLATALGAKSIRIEDAARVPVRDKLSPEHEEKIKRLYDEYSDQWKQMQAEKQRMKETELKSGHNPFEIDAEIGKLCSKDKSLKCYKLRKNLNSINDQIKSIEGGSTRLNMRRWLKGEPGWYSSDKNQYYPIGISKETYKKVIDKFRNTTMKELDKCPEFSSFRQKMWPSLDTTSERDTIGKFLSDAIDGGWKKGQPAPDAPSRLWDWLFEYETQKSLKEPTCTAAADLSKGFLILHLDSFSRYLKKSLTTTTPEGEKDGDIDSNSPKEIRYRDASIEEYLSH